MTLTNEINLALQMITLNLISIIDLKGAKVTLHTRRIKKTLSFEINT